MNCIRCHKEMPVASPFCPWCGAKQERAHSVKTRGNGQGTAIRQGKTWMARVVVGWRIVNGHASPVYRSKRGFRTKNEALAYCPTLKQSASRPAAPSLTFEALFFEWCAAYEQRIAKSTFAAYRSAYKHFAPLHPLKFADILPADLQSCMDACPQGKRTKETMKVLASLLYKYAMHNELVTRNRAETLYTGSGQKVAREAFTFEELDRLWAAVPSEPYAKYVVCMCYLGFRPGEMLSLKKEAFDPATGLIIGGGKTKAGTDRPVPVSPKILPVLLEQHKLPSAYLFPRLSDMHQLSDNYFRKYCFDPLMERMGITGRVAYSCRHTFANLLKRVSGSDTDKAALMGHADASMTKYYQEADLSSLRSIVDSL